MLNLPTRKGMSATDTRRKSVCLYFGASSCASKRQRGPYVANTPTHSQPLVHDLAFGKVGVHKVHDAVLFLAETRVSATPTAINPRHALDELLLVRVGHDAAVLCLLDQPCALDRGAQLGHAALALGAEVERLLNRVEELRVGEGWGRGCGHGGGG